MFKTFDDTFKSESHCVQLADGTLYTAVAHRKGDAEVLLIDYNGRRCRTTLRDALFIPSYPQGIFSVRSATSSGAKVIFKAGSIPNGSIDWISICAVVY